MTARDRGLLLAYRIRPLEPPALVGAAAGSIAAGLFMIPSAPPPPPEVLSLADVTTPLAMVAVALALAAGFVGGRDVDAAERLLLSAPTPHRRAVFLRVALWGLGSAAILWALGGRAEGALGPDAQALTGQALVHLLFATSVTVSVARLAGPLIGGGLALTFLLVLVGASSFLEGFPLDPLAEAGTRAWRETAPRLLAIGAALLALTFGTLGRKGRS